MQLNAVVGPRFISCNTKALEAMQADAAACINAQVVEACIIANRRGGDGGGESIVDVHTNLGENNYLSQRSYQN